MSEANLSNLAQTLRGQELVVKDPKTGKDVKTSLWGMVWGQATEDFDKRLQNFGYVLSGADNTTRITADHVSAYKKVLANEPVSSEERELARKASLAIHADAAVYAKMLHRSEQGAKGGVVQNEGVNQMMQLLQMIQGQGGQ